MMEDLMESVFGKNYIKAHDQGMDMDENTRLVVQHFVIISGFLSQSFSIKLIAVLLTMPE